MLACVSDVPSAKYLYKYSKYSKVLKKYALYALYYKYVQVLKVLNVLNYITSGARRTQLEVKTLKSRPIM